jgi:hypothetical protein
MLDLEKWYLILNMTYHASAIRTVMSQNLTDVVVRIQNQSLYIRTDIISVIIYNDRFFWFLYIIANFFQSVCIMTEILVSL